MRDRAKSILDAGVRYFIKTGIPITSERLYEEYNFGIKPAMIRCELNKLGALGYLEQHHPSGGRRPTHRAYKFFVDGLLSNEEPNTRAELQKNDSLVSCFLGEQKKLFVDELSGRLGVLSVGYETESDEVYNSGLSDLLYNLEIDAKSDFLKVVEDFESLSERLGEGRGWWSGDTEWPQVFVGHSPITKSRHLSVAADRFDFPDGDFLLLLIGPTRMDYQKTLNFFRVFERSLTENIK